MWHLIADLTVGWTLSGVKWRSVLRPCGPFVLWTLMKWEMWGTLVSRNKTFSVCFNVK